MELKNKFIIDMNTRRCAGMFANLAEYTEYAQIGQRLKLDSVLDPYTVIESATPDMGRQLCKAMDMMNYHGPIPHNMQISVMLTDWESHDLLLARYFTGSVVKGGLK